jgi:hypothetical protein
MDDDVIFLDSGRAHGSPALAAGALSNGTSTARIAAIV